MCSSVPIYVKVLMFGEISKDECKTQKFYEDIVEIEASCPWEAREKAKKISGVARAIRAAYRKADL